ncbi:hypothetical protein B0H10DRAFT_2047665 [Mycena sp. CBHHK59/15]|nr:hypothetical protein B0H10DRAFT_2047665 [Mycena sp. CBHHK59/15]
MGNTQSGSTLTRTTAALDSFVAELGTDIIYEKSLGSARFLKTVKCRHHNGYMVIKIFIKPDPADREALTDIANIYNYQSFVETDKAGISTRPFLSVVEKKWIAFQLLNALRDARNRKVSHGDIKSENILVTSWNWVYLSDLHLTNLPTSHSMTLQILILLRYLGRRTCYIAPERAKKSKLAMDESEGKRDGKVTEAMDCFSAGCVIAELFLEGAPLFTLSQLFKYRGGEFNVDSYLGAIEDEGVRNVIKQMIDLEPTARPTFDTLLHTSRGTVFPESFYSFLHNYVSSINDLPSNSPFSTTAPSTAATTTTPASIAPSISSSTVRPSSSLGINATSIPGADPPPPDILPSDSDHRMEIIWSDYESVEPYLVPDTVEETVMNVKVEYNSSTSMSKPFQDILPVELHIPIAIRNSVARCNGPALIILALVTANTRNCSLPSSKVRALDVFLALSSHLTDEAKLDRMVPYIVDLLHDDAAIVRSAAMRTMIQLMMVTVITPSNASVFPEYIIPNIKYVVQDPEVSVRCTYAQCIVQLADTAVRYLEMGQALKAHGTFKLSPEAQEYDHARFEVSYEASMQDLQNSVQEHLSALLMDPSSVKTNDVLLSHMITYLNDRDWLLRHAFFESIVDVAACAGGRSLEEYILPLMIQALSDVEETVVAKVLASLTSLCELGLFQKMRIWELMSATLGFLYHPNMWIRQGDCIIRCLVYLYPSLRHFLKSDVVVIDEQSLLTAMKPPLSRQVFDAAVQWAMKAEKSTFWRGQRRITSKTESPRESVFLFGKRAPFPETPSQKSQDEAQLAKLQQLGMTSSEETKLLAMRDYILKLANAISSFASRLSFEQETDKNLKTIGVIELTKLEARSTDLGTPRPSRAYPHARRPSALGTPLLSPRALSADQNNLRRRLATINGSSSSIVLSHTPPRTAELTPTLPSAGLTPAIERPVSPTESVDPPQTRTTFRPLSRMQFGGADGQKPRPLSGRSSPMSMSTTIRGSFRQRIPSLPPISTYDGQEAGISNLLENLYLDNNRELQHDFGPKVHEGPVSAERDGTTRQTEATLVAHLTSHSDAITSLAVSPDHMFFTVKVWDTARLERNVTSKPRHTYGQHHARVKCVCMLEGVHCFASAADDGSLHIVRFTLLKVAQVIRGHRVDHGDDGEYITCMTHYNTGVLTLWDRRFGLLLKSWHVGVASTGRFVRIHQWSCIHRKGGGSGSWSLWRDRNGLWTAHSPTSLRFGISRRQFSWKRSLPERLAKLSRSQNPTSSFGVDADTSPAAAIAALVHSRVEAARKRSRPSSQSTFQHELLSPPAPDVRALVVGVDSEALQVRKLRLWDLSRLDRTTVLSGLESEHERPSFSTSSSPTASTYVEIWPNSASSGSQSNRPAQRMSLITHNQQNLLNGDRAGVIKIWRVEAGGI